MHQPSPLSKPKVIIVLPAYQAAQTLPGCIQEIPEGVADQLILVDDASSDETLAVAEQLALRVIAHPHNRGYGGNQKTCYQAALDLGADIVVMLHPDGQYDARVIPEMVALLREGKSQWVLGSRFLRPLGPLRGGMPLYKYVGNRILTAIENRFLGWNLSECHTGLRAYTSEFLRGIPFTRNHDGFAFDSQVIFQAKHFGFAAPAEVAVETRYFREASSIGFVSGVHYSLMTLWYALRFWAHRNGWWPCPIFQQR